MENAMSKQITEHTGPNSKFLMENDMSQQITKYT